jgi:thymidylate synthase
LRGDTNIKYLVDNGCHIWDGDAYKNYCGECNEDKWMKEIKLDLPLPNKSYGLYSQEEFINKIKTDDEFAEVWGELGPIYGAQWREWHTKKLIKTTLKDPFTGNDTYMEGDEWIDQIKNLIEQLKINPDSRRLMVSAWNVGQLDQMVLPPCHYGVQVYTRELSLGERLDLAAKTYDVFDPFDFGIPAKVDHDEIDKLYPVPKRAISLMWNQRSVDTFLGLPFNIASYALLLEIIAKEVNMISDELIGNLGDVHLYSNHIEQAKEQIGRKYTADERSEMLKESMGYENYNNAVEELMPFGGGLSEYYEIHKIPYHSRQPYPLPTLKIEGDEPSIIEKTKYWKPDDFVIENYISHPTIKAPLSN